MNNIRKAPWVYPSSTNSKSENKIINDSKNVKVALKTKDTTMNVSTTSIREGVAGGSSGSLSYNTTVRIPKSGVIKK